MLPKIITAVIVVLMLVLTWMFWPRSAGAAAQAPQAACSEQPADAAGASAQAPIGTGHAPLPAAPQHA